MSKLNLLLLIFTNFSAFLVFSLPVKAENNCKINGEEMPCIKVQAICNLAELSFPCRKLLVDYEIPNFGESTDEISLKHIPLFPNVISYSNTSKKDLGIRNSILDYKFELSPASFVDRGLILESGTTWIPAGSETYFEMMDVDDVYQGRTILSEWAKSTSLGLVCDQKNESICAFSRRLGKASKKIEYCIIFKIAKNTFGQPECELVADTHSQKILSAKYTFFPRKDAGGEAEIICTFPDTTVLNATSIVENALQKIIKNQGSLRFSKRAGRISVVSKTFNLDQLADGMFTRMVFLGEFEEVNSVSVDIFDTSKYQPKTNQHVQFRYNRYFSVSPRISNNVIDYREPDAAMGQTIQANYSNIVEEIFERDFEHHQCILFAI